MQRRASAILTALVVAAAGGSNVPPAAAAARTCDRAHAKHAVMSNGRVIIWARSRFETRTYYGCLRGSRRSVKLGTRSDELAVSNFDVSGPYVAFREASGSSAGLGVGVRVVDLRSRTVVSATASGTVGDLQVGRRGVAAWTESGPGFRRARATRRGAPTGLALTDGPIDPGSLAISSDGASAYWTIAGQPQSAPL